MTLLKLDLPKHDTKSIYYVADDINEEGSVSKAPNQNYKLAIKVSSTVNGKKVYKRKVQEFKKVQSLISALAVMQGIRAELKKELGSHAPVIAKFGATKAKKQNYTDSENSHATRTLNDAWVDYMRIKEDKKLALQTLKSYRISYNVHIKPFVGNKILHTIETKQFQDIINNILQTGRSPRTAQTIQQIMRPLFNRELQTKGTLLKTNPVMNTVIPRFNNEKTIDITDEQAKELMSQIYSYEVPVIRSVLVWLTHGRRAGEVRHLKWENIDLQNNTYTNIIILKS